MKLFVLQNKQKPWKNNSSKEVLIPLCERYQLGTPYYHESGKPLLDKAYVSITHSNEYLLIAYDTHPIGIDCEQIRNIHDSLISKLNLDSNNPILDWCRREAVIKLCDDKSYLLKKELSTFYFKEVELNPNYCVVIASNQRINTIKIIKLDIKLDIIHEM